MKNNKLEIKKDVISKLQKDQMQNIKGGGWTNPVDGGLSCNTGDCITWLATTFLKKT